jgi:hypothetical protein
MGESSTPAAMTSVSAVPMTPSPNAMPTAVVDQRLAVGTGPLALEVAGRRVERVDGAGVLVADEEVTAEGAPVGAAAPDPQRILLRSLEA